MARRVVVALLGPVAWTPPGIDPAAWRAALAEDVVDLLATLQEVETAIAAVPADRALAESVTWPGMAVYEVPAATGTAVLAALAGAGYDEAAVVAADAPDLPGLTVGKLLRPLTTRPVALAPVEGSGTGLLGVASRLPVPAWLPEVDLDVAHPAEVRRAAPRPGDVAVTAAWRRMRGPADLAALDPAVEGWETTRALLSSPHP
ncbi:hypothetical protein ABUL04_03460 [Micromonospora harpali]|uniref:MobA-like NTP transferase domain-containing protein n=2 Tax=Micromonospora TaxID=1873 RepID=A0A1C4UWR3_9ACTN|nr:hypothetical protein [Micromonospora haikouensis]SCE76105.1 hypothetical protein GA0070558_105153 [Micromonospora haikouensis]